MAALFLCQLGCRMRNKDQHFCYNAINRGETRRYSFSSTHRDVYNCLLFHVRELSGKDKCYVNYSDLHFKQP